MKALEQTLIYRMKPHPDTQELGCWVSRDELFALFEGEPTDTESVEELEHECARAEETVGDLKSAIESALDELTGEAVDVDAARKALAEVE